MVEDHQSLSIAKEFINALHEFLTKAAQTTVITTFSALFQCQLTGLTM